MQIAANHALGDVWAMGGQPVSALALAAVPVMSEHLVEEDLVALMAGALEVGDYVENHPNDAMLYITT
jgi:selenide,water dikinase